jgi:membrane protein implicated in regulation of membrane protease activity
VYAITAAILLSVVGSVLKTPFIGITLGIILFSALMVIYVYYILPKFNSSTKELREEIWDNQEQTPER